MTTTHPATTAGPELNQQQPIELNQANQIMPTSADTAATTQAILVTGQHPTDEDLWAQALSEIENGNKRPGLWAQAFSLSDGEDQKARAKYLQLRVDQLIAERNLAIAEQRRRAQEVLAAEQAAQDAEQHRRVEEGIKNEDEIIEALQKIHFSAVQWSADDSWTIYGPDGKSKYFRNSHDFSKFAHSLLVTYPSGYTSAAGAWQKIMA